MGIVGRVDTATSRLDSLLERGSQEGCLELSEISELIAECQLEDADVDQLFEQLEQRGVEISDDCGREGSEQVTSINPALAARTTDALELFFTELRRFRLLTASEEVQLAKRIEEGDPRAKERMINSNLRLVVSIARRYPRSEEH